MLEGQDEGQRGQEWKVEYTNTGTCMMFLVQF